MLNIDKRIDDLRVQWKNNPEKRKIIEMQVKILQMAQKPSYFEVDKDVELVKATLF